MESDMVHFSLSFIYWFCTSYTEKYNIAVCDLEKRSQNIPCFYFDNWLANEKKKHVAYVIAVSDSAGYRKQSDMLSQNWINLK